MVGSNRMQWVCRWHVYGEHLGNIPCACQRVSGGSSPCEVEPRGIRCVILPVDAVEDREYMRHGGGGYKMGGDGRAALLPCDPLLHQSDVSLLLLSGAVLGA